MLTEADTCRKFVVPKLQGAGWDNDPHSIAEQRFPTNGRIVVQGSQATRRPGKRVDFILANPPFNMSDWGSENLRQDVRWKFGMPPVNNANYAWIQHFIHHLSPVAVAGFVMAKTTRSAHSCSMKTTEGVRKYAAEQGIAEEEALKRGMEEKSKEFVEKGAEVYAKV